MTDCYCKGFVGKTRTGVVLINHTYRCLVEQRGEKSLREHYGASAKQRKVA